MSIERKSLFVTIALGAVLAASQATAHASEQGLVLLLPTGIYAMAGTVTVTASILLAALMPRNVPGVLFKGVRLKFGGRSETRNASDGMSFVLSLVFLGLIYIGFYGPTDPQNNLLPLSIWTVWWIGVFVVQGTLFDIWAWVNPWTGTARYFGLGEKPSLKIPDFLAAWPAVFTLVCFQLFLLADVAPSDPPRLAKIALGYWVFTLVGIELFGRDDWLRRVECFSVMFRLIGSLRPVQMEDGIRVGLAGWGGLRLAPLDTSTAVFCLTILAGGSFDGVNETFWWLAQLGINPLEFPGRSAVMWSSGLGLIFAILLLCLVFGLAIWIGLAAIQQFGSAEPIDFSHAFNLFAVTLLPIALGYHFAHYLITFMVQIKVTLSTASDPLAFGWNLAGLGAVKATTGFLSIPETVKALWLTQAGAVVVSHVVSVLMSHHLACKLWPKNRDVILGQLGLSVLMIAYTVFGLWLLASPRGA